MKLEINQLSGTPTTWAVGNVNGVPFYFRVRAHMWAFDVGHQPFTVPDYMLSGHEPEGGWDGENSISDCIKEAAEQYDTHNKGDIKPPDARYRF